MERKSNQVLKFIQASLILLSCVTFSIYRTFKRIESHISLSCFDYQHIDLLESRLTDFSPDFFSVIYKILLIDGFM